MLSNSKRHKSILSTQNRLWRKFRYWLYRRSPRTKFDLIIIVTTLILGFLTYLALTTTSPISDNPDFIIWVLNADIIALLILSFLIGRRVFSLWSNRKKNIAASKLHVQLVFTFGILAALPALIMTSFSAAFFYFGVQSWFSDRVKTAIEKSLSVAESYLAEHQQVIKSDALALATDFGRDAAIYLSDSDQLKRFVGTQSFLRNLPELVLLHKDGRILVRTELALSFDKNSVYGYWLPRLDGEEAILLNDKNNEKVQALVPIRNHEDLYFYVGRAVDPDVLNHLSESRSAVEEYSALRTRSSDFQLSLTFIFITVALLLVLSAIWIGLLIARRLVQPIASLVQATEKVSQGDFTVHINDKATHNIQEFRSLAHAFNDMTDELAQQRQELITANTQIDARRRFTETILAGVSSGIVVIDQNHIVTLVNDNAETLFSLERKNLLQKSLSDVFSDLADLLKKALSNPAKLTQGQIEWHNNQGQTRIFLVRIALSFIGGNDTGAVITFDDITELESAQRKAAWGDVARRIAHEIKNPLTPIQLATERLRRRYTEKFEDSDKDVFNQCTQTIIRHVEDIQNMVNAFSNFAKMPQPSFKKMDIVHLIKEVVIFQKQAHESIDFSMALEDNIEVLADSNLIHQVLVNLIKNAIESLDQKGQIIVEAEREEGQAIIRVIDNGKGISQELKDRITEPYISTKEKGSGLGLAIVIKIIEEHNGHFSIDNLNEEALKKYGFTTGVASMIQLPLSTKDNG